MQINFNNFPKPDDKGMRLLDFSFSHDMSDIDFWGEKPFAKPVAVSGQAKDQNGVLTIEYEAEYSFSSSCARCLCDVCSQHKKSFFHTVLNDPQDENSEEISIIVIENGILDLDNLVTSDILLQLDNRVLCSENCKGLCPKCGANLNQTECGCELKEPDPRFDVLRRELESRKNGRSN